MLPTATLTTLPVTLRKRNGQTAAFDSRKIFSAICRAGEASGEFGGSEAQLLTSQVVKILAHLSEPVPEVERIQDIVEQTLISANHFATARAYIVYREQHKRLRQDHKTLVDVASSINEYLDRADWRVSANANQGYSLGGLILNAGPHRPPPPQGGYSLGGLILNTSGKVIANYWLNHVYPEEIG